MNKLIVPGDKINVRNNPFSNKWIIVLINYRNGKQSNEYIKQWINYIMNRILNCVIQVINECIGLMNKCSVKRLKH